MRDLLPVDALIQILCYPWLELKFELNALFIQNRHTIRSSIRISSIILSVCAGLFIIWYNPTVLNFFSGIINALEFIPDALQTNAAIALSVLCSSTVGAYTSKAIIRSICKCKFGDPDFFLTTKRKAELRAIFLSQDIEMEEIDIQEVVDFCLRSLREAHLSPSREIGATQKDWEQILNSLIYDANLDEFLDQQEALEYKHTNLLEKQQIIENYKQSNPSNLTAFSEAADEETPFLPTMSTSYGSDISFERERMLATITLARFRYNHQKHAAGLSDEQVLARCAQQLRDQASFTNRQILNSYSVRTLRASRTTSPAPSELLDHLTESMANLSIPPSPAASATSASRILGRRPSPVQLP